MPLTTLAYVKSALGYSLSDTTQDVQLRALLDAADAAVKRYCGRDLEQQTYTEYVSGNNTYRLALRQVPVTSVTGVYLDDSGYFGTNPEGSFDPATTELIEGVDFVLDRRPGAAYSKTGILFRINTVWEMMYRFNNFNRLSQEIGPAFGNFKVIYVAGYSPIPVDLQYAVALLVQFMKRSAPYGGMVLGSEKIGDYAYTLLSQPKAGQLPELGTIASLLSSYKAFGW